MSEDYSTLKLTPQQEQLILEAVGRGLKDFDEKFAPLKNYVTNKNAVPWVRTICVNEAIYQAIKGNQDLGMVVEKSNAGNYEYLKVSILDRNIILLIKHLPSEMDVPDQSEYLLQFCSLNAQRRMAEGYEEIAATQLELPFIEFQQELLLLNESPLEIPFCLVVTYDGRKGPGAILHQGALKPDLQDWIFINEITSQNAQHETSSSTLIPSEEENNSTVIHIPLDTSVSSEGDAQNVGLSIKAPVAQSGRKGEEESGT